MSLDIFKHIFTKEVLDFQTLKNYITPQLEKRDFAIAEFLAYETPEVFWLVRKLNEEYIKAFPAERTAQEIFLNNNFIDNLAKTITYNIHEIGSSDHATIITQDIITNTIEIALPTKDTDDIISTIDDDDLESQMDTLNDDDMLTDTNNTRHNNLPSSLVASNTQQPSLKNSDASSSKQSNKLNNKQTYASITKQTNRSSVTADHNKL